jgi:hypothetical protein
MLIRCGTAAAWQAHKTALDVWSELVLTWVLLLCCCAAAWLQVCCGAVLGVLFGIFYPNPTAGQLLVGV